MYFNRGTRIYLDRGTRKDFLRASQPSASSRESGPKPLDPFRAPASVIFDYILITTHREMDVQ